ncbi:MAG TPA: hypothetical protein VHJ38_04220 [Nitrososphaeraceae archaeon]|nr:hypothetical protein [Nitrososphaeraceae archaeon]
MVNTLLTEGQAGYATIATTVIADYHNAGVNWSTEVRAFGIDAALTGERSVIANCCTYIHR